jgi:hypothetical protein
MVFQQWLTGAGALGQDGVPAGQLSIFNATVGPANAPAQPWVSSNGSAMAFTFNAPVAADAGPACGRAAYTELHVTGNPAANDTTNVRGGTAPPGGCSTGKLTPQEAALEFMLFDLAGCVTPDTAPVPTTFP